VIGIRVLGPLEVRVGGATASVGGPRQRRVLVRLIAARGQTVSADRLIEDLYGGESPPGALAALQSYVSHLRRVLEPGRRAWDRGGVLVASPPGYALRLGAEAVDAWVFEDEVRRAPALGDAAAVHASLSAALTAWRGPAFQEFSGLPWADLQASRLEELRLAATEKCADAALRLGYAAQIVADLNQLAAEHPLREESWRLLALALYQSGRQGDALAALRRARTLLAEELGVEPGPLLRELQSDILAQAPHLTVPAAAAVPARGYQALPAAAPLSKTVGEISARAQSSCLPPASNDAMPRPSRSPAGTGIEGCLLARFDGVVPPPWLLKWLDDGLAGVLLFAANLTSPEQARSVISQLRSHNPHVLIAVDEEGGIVTRLEAASGSSYPGNAALGAVDDVTVTRAVAQSIGAMLADVGISLNLAPVADLGGNPANPVIGVRSFGADPARVAAHTAAFVTGLQANMVAACAKHFPGHGRAAADSHTTLPSVAATLPELLATDLVPFRAAIEAGVRSVMTGHVVFPAIDELPATLSRRLVTEVLRGELGFDGVIITDALGMAGIGDGAKRAAGAIRAIAAGADLICLPAEEAAQLRARDTVAAAFHGGVLSRDRVAEAAARVRALANWANPHPVAAADPALGAAVARRAMLADGAVTPLRSPPYVLDAGGQMSLRLGDSAASLLLLLRERLPGTEGVRLTGPADLAGLDERIAAASGRPLVVVVRDAHQHDWQRELLHRSLAARPDAQVVGTGTMHDRALAGPRYLGTRGGSRASLLAAANVLTGEPAA